MVSQVPSPATPAVDNGNVQAIARVGKTIVMGGNFTSVDGQQRSNLAAFNEETGDLLPTRMDVNGSVWAIANGPTPGTVFVGGAFTSIGGTAREDLALVDVATGKPVALWSPPVNNFGEVNALRLYGNRLFVAGTFTKMGGISHEGFATLNATTGALDAFMGLSFTGHHNDTGTGAQGRVGVDEIDITPDGRRLVAIGNFKYVNGLLRDQVAQIDISGSSASLITAWATDWYTAPCNKKAVDSYVRGVSFSPDGSYFVVSAKGGFHPTTGCDAALRYETNVLSTDAQPTWRIETGGDTFWGVAVTDNAVYVGGHHKWVNNPTLRAKAGPGAVARPGIVALDPASGRPLAWNPGRNPRGVAVFVILPLDTGIYIGSNTSWIGSHDYFRPRIAFFPYAGGAQLASTSTASLPGRVYVAAPRSFGKPASVYSVPINASGASTGPMTPTGMPFPVSSAGSMLLGDQLFTGDVSSKMMFRRTFKATNISAAVAVDPYHDPLWDNVSNGSGGTYRGASPTLYAQYASVTGAAYADGRMLYTQSGSSKLLSRWFSPDSGVMDERVIEIPSSVSFAQAGGMFTVDNRLFYVTRNDGSLWSIAFNGKAVTGSPSQVGGPAIDGIDYAGSSLWLGP